MGKENELLEAARVGNSTVIERLLSTKQKNVLSQALRWVNFIEAYFHEVLLVVVLVHDSQAGHRVSHYLHCGVGSLLYLYPIVFLASCDVYVSISICSIFYFNLTLVTNR